MAFLGSCSILSSLQKFTHSRLASPVATDFSFAHFLHLEVDLQKMESNQVLLFENIIPSDRTSCCRGCSPTGETVTAVDGQVRLESYCDGYTRRRIFITFEYIKYIYLLT